MNTKDTKPVWQELFDQLSEPLASNKELAQRVTDLERRVAAHDEILNFLRTILYQLKKAGGSLPMTKAQRAELNRWLDRYEENPNDGSVESG